MLHGRGIRHEINEQKRVAAMKQSANQKRRQSTPPVASTSRTQQASVAGNDSDDEMEIVSIMN